jgi:cell division protein FtsB
MRVSWRFLVEIVAPAFCVCWIGYFAYGAFLGATGFHMLTRIEAQAEVKGAELDALMIERRRLERVADQLNPKSLDPDMVDEKIRSVLGYVADRDVVIPRDQVEQMLADIAASGR